MREEVDKERVLELISELQAALGEDGAKPRKVTLDPLADAEPVYTTIQAARLLGVSPAWMTANVTEFPGAFRLSDGQRANYRFPRSSIEAYKQAHSVQ